MRQGPTSDPLPRHAHLVYFSGGKISHSTGSPRRVAHVGHHPQTRPRGVRSLPSCGSTSPSPVDGCDGRPVRVLGSGRAPGEKWLGLPSAGAAPAHLDAGRRPRCFHPPPRPGRRELLAGDATESSGARRGGASRPRRAPPRGGVVPRSSDRKRPRDRVPYAGCRCGSSPMNSAPSKSVPSIT